MIAIIPAAGKGTRMAAVTHGKPKELLRLGDQTILARVVDEARTAGADAVVIVNAKDKPGIDEAAAGLDATVVYQDEMRGLGHAIAIVPTEDDALILLGDCVFAGTSPATRMANILAMGLDGVIAVETVPDEEVHRYGIVDIDAMGTIKSLLEKPRAEEVESRYAVAGRYAFSPRFLAFLRDYVEAHLPHRTGEIGVTEIISAAIAAGMEFKAVALQPGQQRVDCGTPEEYAQARWLNWD
ncbi:MAG: sugar phosphate nucleotidyltransferase [Fimbriimonas sp.]